MEAEKEKDKEAKITLSSVEADSQCIVANSFFRLFFLEPQCVPSSHSLCGNSQKVVLHWSANVEDEISIIGF